MTIDYVLLVQEVVGVAVLFTFGYYAVRLLASFRKGMLERGWRLVVFGAILLGVAQIPFLVAAITSGNLSTTLVAVGDLVRFMGMISLILGFRAQYQIWRVDRKTPPSTWGTRTTIER
ncbi:MAG TPA: hypothetical protein VED17_09285 [Nitrososphaerales archaeon]|nr:hypothetical protein [Nitrososphaerales archaeon]